jgi:hypothetical protein
MMNKTPQMLMGMKIHISRPFAKVQCSPRFVELQSPELVAETNTWMAEFFGYSNLVKDGQVIKMGDDRLLMTQATFDKLKEATK